MKKYGWVQDRFGLSWQIAWGNLADVGQKFTPSLMFSGVQQGRAEEAVRFYTSLFNNSAISGIVHYGAGEQGPEGQVTHAQFTLNGQTFMAMDSGVAQPFTFNEAVSLVVNCNTQDEVDFFWDKLTADGGQESQCGWLKDKFGVSWQIIPEALPRLLGDPDPAVAQRAMAAMMQMGKINIAQLTEAPQPTNNAITVETTVHVPVEKVSRSLGRAPNTFKTGTMPPTIGIRPKPQTICARVAISPLRWRRKTAAPVSTSAALTMMWWRTGALLIAWKMAGKWK